MTSESDRALTRALERGEVPNAGFPHASHLRVAWVYLDQSPTVDAALARMSTTLRAFAASAGRADKYSDAITAFWMYQMAAVRALMPDAGIDDVLRAYPRLLDKNLLLAYYSNDAAAPRSTDSPGDPSDRPVPRASA
jgi:hypothetical protein